MGVESVSVAGALFHEENALSLSLILLQQNTLKAKDIQAIEAIQRTFTYKITEVQHLN